MRTVATRGVLGELCQQALLEAMGFYSFVKDNAQLIDNLFPIVGRCLPFNLHILDH